ncbi:hypothetical protein EST38_g12245 [Candolleomyces aberdarensis]|uniref:Uncharacterized protein n=1 Tax=Candolleomyces aberdarensis TaxID=2316362 RepID=A0A4Q2D604_9AGAR|nr:hypothetical protein EST38_g12245 [Candolleomyces aberdarensis]
MGRRRNGKKAKHATVTDAKHYDHPDLKAHVKAVKASLRESETLPHEVPVSSIEVLRPYVLRARARPLLISPFLDVQDVLWEGLGVKDKSADEEDTFYSEEYLNIVDNIMPGQFHRVLRQIYKGEECSNNEDKDDEGDYDLEKGQELAGIFIDLLHEAYRSSRNDLVRNLKSHIPLYLTKSTTLSRPLLNPSAKGLRGFNHVDFGAAIVGIKYRNEYRANPEAFCAEVNNGTRQHVYDSLPSFLFADDKEYDPPVPEAGLGTGHLLERCLRLELTGDFTAFGAKSTSRKASKPFMWRVSQVTAEIIPVLTAVIYVASSSMGEWGTADGSYDIVRLHQSVLRIFRARDPWTTATLKRLTESIPELLVAPKSKKSKGVLDDPALAAIPDPADIIFEKRKERAAAAQEEERQRQRNLAREEERKRREVAAHEKERKRREVAAHEKELEPVSLFKVLAATSGHTIMTREDGIMTRGRRLILNIKGLSPIASTALARRRRAEAQSRTLTTAGSIRRQPSSTTGSFQRQRSFMTGSPHQRQGSRTVATTLPAVDEDDDDMYGDEPTLKVARKRSRVVLSEDENDTYNIDDGKIADVLEREKRIQRALRSTEETQLATTPNPIRGLSQTHPSQSARQTPFRIPAAPPSGKRQRTGPVLNSGQQQERRQLRPWTNTQASSASACTSKRR